MKLSELGPEWLKIIDERTRSTDVEMAEADGIIFLCPKCFQKNGGPVGTHSIICWRPSVPPSVTPGPGRWEFNGTGLDDLSLVAGSSSILLQGGCEAHFLIQNGEIRDC
jgi:hypothetical protein